MKILIDLNNEDSIQDTINKLKELKDKHKEAPYNKHQEIETEIKTYLIDDILIEMEEELRALWTNHTKLLNDLAAGDGWTAEGYKEKWEASILFDKLSYEARIIDEIRSEISHKIFNKIRDFLKSNDEEEIEN